MPIAAIRPMRRAFFCCLLRQLAGENRDEDDVVDAEHDLEHGQGDQRDQTIRSQKGFEVHSGISSRSTGRPPMMCCSTISSTSASVTRPYQTVSGYTTTVGPFSH